MKKHLFAACSHVSRKKWSRLTKVMLRSIPTDLFPITYRNQWVNKKEMLGRRTRRKRGGQEQDGQVRTRTTDQHLSGGRLCNFHSFWADKIELYCLRGGFLKKRNASDVTFWIFLATAIVSGASNNTASSSLVIGCQSHIWGQQSLNGAARGQHSMEKRKSTLQIEVTSSCEGGLFPPSGKTK